VEDSHQGITVSISSQNRVLASDEAQSAVVSCDMTLFIRLLEIAREEIKDDASLHQLVERVSEAQAAKGRPLTMDDYAAITATSQPKPTESTAMSIQAIKRVAASAGSVDEKVKKHNALVNKKGHLNVDKKHPDFMKTAPKGYTFSVSNKLVKQTASALTAALSSSDDKDLKAVRSRGLQAAVLQLAKDFKVKSVNTDAYNDDPKHVGVEVIFEGSVDVEGGSGNALGPADLNDLMKISEMVRSKVKDGEFELMAGEDSTFVLRILGDAD
jgi:hypothetical protein